LLNLYTWMREPVLPASIMRAYWMSGLSFEYDVVHSAFASPEALLPPEESDAERCGQHGVQQCVPTSAYLLTGHLSAQESTRRAV
jgi:hypothetical protein